MATCAPWYVRNEHLHRDLKVPTVEEFCRGIGQRFFDTAAAHFNTTISESVQYRPEDRFKHRRPLNALAASSGRP